LEKRITKEAQKETGETGNCVSASGVLRAAGLRSNTEYLRRPQKVDKNAAEEKNEKGRGGQATFESKQFFLNGAYEPFEKG